MNNTADNANKEYSHLGREGVFLRDRADILAMRLKAIKSKQCANKKNKYYCPEVFLDVVADKLTSTAVLFLNVELLSEFFYNVSLTKAAPTQSKPQQLRFSPVPTGA